MKIVLVAILVALRPFDTSAAGTTEYSKCLAAQNNANVESAIEFCSAAVKKGHQGAKLTLGHLHFLKEVPDYDLAKKWYLAFAESKFQGFQYGYAMLGKVALKQENYIKAMEWFELCNQPPYKGCSTAIEKLKKHNQSLRQVPAEKLIRSESI